MAPWELARQPAVWSAWALEAEGAEMEAQEIQANEARRRVGKTDAASGPFIGGEHGNHSS